MAIADYPSDARPTSIDDVRSHARLVQAVLSRLDGRAQLSELARQIFDGLAGTNRKTPDPAEGVRIDWYYGEQDIITICGSAKTDPSDTVNFQCNSGDFDCTAFGFPGGFTCTDTFGGCAGDAAKYNCAKDYSCKADLFDCHLFNCGQTSPAGTFNCDSKFDFICGGPQFNCTDNFQCTGGHIFYCSDTHGCKDSFQCNATGNPACTNDYSRNGGSDTTSGDFVCGQQGGGADTFNCSATFQCTAFDEFECSNTASFNCGDGAGTGDNFNCGKVSKFECRDTGGFVCNATATFDCSGQYFPPPPP